VTHLNGQLVVFNQPKTLLTGLVASNGLLHPQLLDLLARWRRGGPPTGPGKGT
jgi:hypothetical protein